MTRLSLSAVLQSRVHRGRPRPRVNDLRDLQLVAGLLLLYLPGALTGCFGDCGQFTYQSVPTVKPANGWCSRDRRKALAELNMSSASITKARPVIMLKLPRTGSEWITSLLSSHPAIGSCYHELLHNAYNTLGGLDAEKSLWLASSAPAFDAMDAALKCHRFEDSLAEWEAEMRRREEELRMGTSEDRCLEHDTGVQSLAETRTSQCEVFCAAPCFNMNPYKIVAAGAHCTGWLAERHDEEGPIASPQTIAPLKTFFVHSKAKVLMLVRDNTFASALSEYKAAWATEHKPCGKLNYFLKSKPVADCYAKLRIHADVSRLVGLWKGYDTRRRQMLELAHMLLPEVVSFVLKYEEVAARKDLPPALWKFLGVPPRQARSSVIDTSPQKCWRHAWDFSIEIAVAFSTLLPPGPMRDQLYCEE